MYIILIMKSLTQRVSIKIHTLLRVSTMSGCAQLYKNGSADMCVLYYYITALRIHLHCFSVTQLVEVLRYSLESRGFDFRRGL
jgi:hypothetical protein